MKTEDLEFVRYATEGDVSAGVRVRDSLWEYPDGATAWLTPMDVQSRGLGDKLREATERLSLIESVGQPQDAQIDATKSPGDASPGPSDLLDLIGGHSGGWRWSYLEDEDALYVCLDNKPAIDEAVANYARPPALQQAAVPYDILKAIFAMAEATT